MIVEISFSFYRIQVNVSRHKHDDDNLLISFGVTHRKYWESIRCTHAVDYNSTNTFKIRKEEKITLKYFKSNRYNSFTHLHHIKLSNKFNYRDELFYGYKTNVSVRSYY